MPYRVRKVWDGPRQKYGCEIELSPTGLLALFPYNPERWAYSAAFYLRMPTDNGHEQYSVLWRPASVTGPDHMPTEARVTRFVPDAGYGWYSVSIEPARWDELFAMIRGINRLRRPEPAIDWLLERSPHPFPALMEKLQSWTLSPPSPVSLVSVGSP